MKRKLVQLAAARRAKKNLKPDSNDVASPMDLCAEEDETDLDEEDEVDPLSLWEEVWATEVRNFQYQQLEQVERVLGQTWSDREDVAYVDTAERRKENQSRTRRGVDRKRYTGTSDRTMRRRKQAAAATAAAHNWTSIKDFFARGKSAEESARYAQSRTRYAIICIYIYTSAACA